MQDTRLAAVDVPGDDVDLVSAGRKNDILLIERPLGLGNRHLALGVARGLEYVLKHTREVVRQSGDPGVEVDGPTIDTALVLERDVPVGELHSEHGHYRVAADAHQIGAYAERQDITGN